MNWTLKKHILASTVIPMLVMAFVLSFVPISGFISMGTDRMNNYREALVNQKKKELMNYTDIAIRLIELQPQEEARETIKKLKYGENGYFFIHDYNGYFLSHPDPKLNETNQSDLRDANGVYILRELVKVCAEKGEGFIPYSWKKLGTEQALPKLSYVKAIKKWNWIVGTGLYIDDIDSMVDQEREKMHSTLSSLIIKNITISILIVMIISLTVAYLLNRHLNKPMEHIISTLQHFDNDLTVKINNRFKYELGQLATQFNSLIAQLHHIISMVSDVTMDLTSSISDISATAEEQAAISSEQSASVSEITTTMEEFSATSKQIAEHSNAVVEIAARALADTRRGAEAVETVMMKMNEISEDNRNNIKEIVDLGRKSREITKVMEIINTIADQTKLIAFNAALEASSAGEAGKRFGVVAAEIRRLADSVMDSTGEIDTKINEIQEAISRLVIVSENGSKRIQEGMDYSKQTAQLLVEVVEGAKGTANAAKQISLSTQQQETASDQVVVALREIDEGARQASASIIQMSTTTADLKNLADNLEELVKKFHLKKHEAKKAV